MEGFDHTHGEKQDLAGAVDIASTANANSFKGNSKGSAIQESGFIDELNKTFDSQSARSAKSTKDKPASAPSGSIDDHNHAKPEGAGNPALHISLSQVDGVRSLNTKKIRTERDLIPDVGKNGDFLLPGGGKNTVIGSGDKDVILATGGGFNTITGGGRGDTFILGSETTNRIFDFNPSEDRIVIDKNLDLKNIVIAQGKNQTKGGLDQPLDSVNNALIIDKSTEHILASLPFVKASSLSENFITQLDTTALDNLEKVGFKAQKGNGQLTGTKQHDKLAGGDGDDFLYVGDDGFKFKTAKGTGPGEFPFPTDSPGVTELEAELKGGTFRVNGTYKDFDALPLFSQGEKEIDPKAKILNGSDPKALVEGFLKVPEDVEGNKLSGTHLHFSPSGDDRGNFADATVVRFFENTPNDDKKSGTITGEFKLTPEEQAALLAGNLYVNVHTNVDGDGDGKAGFPTGENRINFNRNVVQFT